MPGQTFFALVPGAVSLVFLLVVVLVVVLAVRVVGRRGSGWAQTAERRGWQHATGTSSTSAPGSTDG